jgi:hypothetical protein
MVNYNILVICFIIYYISVMKVKCELYNMYINNMLIHRLIFMNNHC